MPLPPPSRPGPRVRLEPVRAGDRDAVLALARASRAFHRGWASPPASASQFAARLALGRRPDFIALGIRRRADAALLGVIELSQITHGRFQNACLGYYVGAPFARQGYMREALALTLRYAFGPLRLHRVEANIRPGNAASLALVARLGFTREGYSRRYLKLGGRWRDHERWALLREDWRPARAGTAAARASAAG